MGEVIEAARALERLAPPMPNPEREDIITAEECLICGQPSDELNGEGECPGCVDERVDAEGGPDA